MSNQVIREALPHLPQEPGVYLMRDAQGQIIYVGKAKRLRARVASYAHAENLPTYYQAKVLAMVAKVEAVEFVVTTSEKEALLLESTLIKRHRPRYNIDLRDDKSYPYFRLSLQDDFPRLSLARRPPADGARYFGPFESVGHARHTLRLLQRILPLRRCSDRVLAARKRPCLDYETGLCPGPCAGKISREDYRALVQQTRAFLEGQGQEVAAQLERSMRELAATERFEEAAKARDRWQALTHTLERQRVARAQGRDLDVVALHDQEGALRLAWLKVRAGRVVASHVRELPEAPLSPEEAMAQALVGLYQDGPPPPGLILLSHLPEDPSLVAELLAELAGERVELKRPQRGENRGLLDLAGLNAAMPRVAAADPAQVAQALQRKLGLAVPPARLECVDISHLGGSLTVASLVAMQDGNLAKDGYRRYKIVSLDGQPDDYAAMAEVVARRLGGDMELPDLLVLDGGRGQLSAATRAMEALPRERRPPLAALAKGQEGQPDRLYLPGRKNPVAFKPREPALLMLMRLRDEAHRFAVEYHRLLRAKALTRSILEEVPGVGPRLRARLLKVFGSLKSLKLAQVQDLVQRGGLSRATAEKLKHFLGSLDSPPPGQ
jgi:excinuclease ABC subunit C